MAGRVILSGIVHVKHGIEYKMRHLTIRCQGPTCPAKLEMFSAEGEKTKLRELSFTKLQDVCQCGANGESSSAANKLIILKMKEGEGLTFYAKSDIEHNTWYIYCYVLANIPTYPIPDTSHYHIPLDSFRQEIDPKILDAISIWRVYIINEGVGKALRCQGFHNITINRNSTLSIINCSNQVSVATWDRDKIRRCGYLDSLVFIEAGRRCHGGAGMLWMYCPQFSAHFGDCLHRFLFNKATEDTETSPTCPRNFARTPNGHMDFDDGLSVNRKPFAATFPRTSTSHDTEFSGHMCSSSPARVLNSVPKSLSSSLGSLLEVPSDHNEFHASCMRSTSENELCSPCDSLSSHRNIKRDTPHKPPILPRKIKKIKPPVPPRHFGPCINHSEHDTTPALRSDTQSSAVAENPEVTNSFYRHKKQANTHEGVILRSKNIKRRSGDIRNIELNTLLGCWVDLSEILDVTSILPYLCYHRLLTTYDREKLINASITNCEKVQHLLSVLPKKDKGWLTKFLDCLCKSTDGTGHAGLAQKLSLTYEEELKKYDHYTGSATARSYDHEVPVAKTTESFPVYLEVEDGSFPYVFNVTSTELVESLIHRIQTELNVTCPFDITLKLDPSQKKLHSSNSLGQSRVFRNSCLLMNRN